MSDKSFKVKSGLQIPGVTSANILTTDVDGNVSSSATLPITSGGTGQTSANNALNALLPLQNGSTINYALESDGVNTSWQKLYNQTIKNNGTTVTPRGIVNIVGGTFTDSSLDDTTTLTIPTEYISNAGGSTITASTASTKGLIIKGADSQTANLQEWQNSSGTSISYINSSGNLNTSAPVINGSIISTTIRSATSSPFYLTNLSSQNNIISSTANGSVVYYLPDTSTLTVGQQFHFKQLNGYTYSLYTYTGQAAGGGNVMQNAMATATVVRTDVNTSAAWSISCYGGNYTTGNGGAVYSDGPVLLNPTINSISSSLVSTAATLFSNITTGSIALGNGLTTGSVNIANGTAITTGIINIGSGASANNKSINIGTSSTSGTTSIVIGSSSGATSNITLNGNVTFTGTTTNINTTNLVVEDKNIVIADVTTPTDTTADGAGITIKGTTDKTFNWVQSTAAFTSSEPISAPAFKSAGTAVSSNITLVSGYRYFVDTTSARTLTLPSMPSLGDEIQIFDASGSAFTNNITLSRNGNKINGISDDAIIDINGASAILTYTGSTYGWRFE